ncbi:MAG: hypothetical protein N5P05_001752 [Chroococcopsis gigantea SAG 12.99]|jgi:hypothetical protein|nr:hypothetical protein [Chroococcopsis gigantea SAG 12.99]
MGKRLFLVLLGLTITVAPAMALNNSLDDGGIQAERLHQAPYNLTGKKIAIGQVEIGRAGVFGHDKIAKWNPPLKLQGIFFRDGKSKPNTNTDNHASMVAAVMVSKDKRIKGVAPEARLYSGAVGSLRQAAQPEECLTAQTVASQNGGDVRAINFSFGESLGRDPRNEARLDGNALLTQCIDWSSRVHDVLYVIAGNQGKGGIPIPTDHYNGITTAYTTMREGKFRKVDFANISALPEGIGKSLIKREINTDGRRSINLLAPGNKVSLFDLRNRVNKVSGTSFAAPHITASVALLQEYGDRNLRARTPHWSLDSRRHEVMKAVLINSADKLQDQGDGLLLGMSRTVIDKANRTWLDSEAYRNPKIPLDMQMGAGQLNVFRAYQQFSGGQWKPGELVSPVGWDYNSLDANAHRDYILKRPLQENSYVSVTLAWDRRVELSDSNGNDRYDMGETFRDRGLNRLDLYLLSADEDNNTRYACASISDVDSVQHIFCPVPKAGQYKIRVQYRQRENEAQQSYGLAWWTVEQKPEG